MASQKKVKDSRSLSFSKGRSDKFWNIELHGSSYTVAFGRIGSNGQAKTKEFADSAAARKAFDKIVAEKLDEGYIDAAKGKATAAKTTKTSPAHGGTTGIARSKQRKRASKSAKRKRLTFAEVYPVADTTQPVKGTEVDALTRTVYRRLPVGYREYMATFGNGTLCGLVRVRTPAHIRKRIESDQGSREAFADSVGCDWYKPGPLRPEDVLQAVIFATSLEGDIYFCCPRFGADLFEIPRQWNQVTRFKDGLYGLVKFTAKRTKYDSPFFEPADEKRRRRCGFEVRDDLPPDRLIDEIQTRWGSTEIRRFRPGQDYEHIFIRAIGGLMVLSTERKHIQNPAGSCFVNLQYENTSAAAVRSFVKAVQLKGGRCQWEKVSSAWPD